MKYVLFALVLSSISASQAAYAACTTPEGVEGEIIYNRDWKVMQFCDSERWIGMGSFNTGSSEQSRRISGEIAAFDLDECPDGWSEYAPSSGRFLRGRCIDSETCPDPDGTRLIGNVQDDDFKAHSHTFSGVRSNYLGSWVGASISGESSGHSARSTSSVGGAETRPVNVAVLFCRYN